MARDRLSEILDLVEVRSVVSGAAIGRGPWRTHAAIVDDLKFIAVVWGCATVTVDEVPQPLTLTAGDVAVLNGRTWLTLEGGHGEGGEPVEIAPLPARAVRGDIDTCDADTIIGGCIELDSVGRQVLLNALPPVTHVQSSGAGGLRLQNHTRGLFSEIVEEREGADFAVRHYGQLLILECLRGSMQNVEMPAGWLKALSDEPLRPALALIHREPAKTWSLDDLARASMMSRTAFAQRFRDVAGTPPHAYLLSWRMLVAQRALRDGETRVGTLAIELGYASESAFSSAFKRHVGESPRAYRSRFANGIARATQRPAQRRSDTPSSSLSFL